VNADVTGPCRQRRTAASLKNLKGLARWNQQHNPKSKKKKRKIGIKKFRLWARRNSLDATEECLFFLILLLIIIKIWTFISSLSKFSVFKIPAAVARYAFVSDVLTTEGGRVVFSGRLFRLDFLAQSRANPDRHAMDRP
jgi:hypothetical protein